MQLSPKISGYLFAATGASLFATKGIVIKLALAIGVDAFTTLAWRMILSVPIFVLVGIIGHRRTLARGQMSKLNGKIVLQAGLVGALGYYVASYLDFTGLEYVTAQFDRLILMTYPVFVVLISAVVLKTKITGKMVLALMTSYAGLAIIFLHDFSSAGSNVTKGGLMVLGAAVAFACYQLLAKPLIDKIGAQLFTSIAMASAGLFVIIHFALSHDLSALALGRQAMIYMVGIAFISTVLPAYLMSAALARIGPQPSAVVGNVSPLVTTILAVSVLGEAFTLFHAAGTLMVIVGILIFTREK